MKTMGKRGEFRARVYQIFLDAGGHVPLRTLVEQLGVNLSTAQYHCQFLVREGKLERFESGNRGNRQQYRIPGTDRVTRLEAVLRLADAMSDGIREICQRPGAQWELITEPREAYLAARGDAL